MRTVPDSETTVTRELIADDDPNLARAAAGLPIRKDEE